MGIDDFSVNSIKAGINYIKEKGINELWSMMKYRMSGPGIAYNGWYKEKHEADEEELAGQRAVEFEYSPLISILVPVYLTPENCLRSMIESVRNQTYSNWELVLVDGSRVPGDETEGGELSVYDKVYSIETERIIANYIELDERIKYRLMEENLGVSGNTNVALDMAKGEYIAVVKHDDIITDDALYHVVNALQERRYDIVYGDEDRMSEDGTKFSNPMFKPDFSNELLEAYNYIYHFPVVKTVLARGVGGFHDEYDGALDYDFILRCVENQTEGIHHIARILYHWRKSNYSKSDRPDKEYQNESGKKALSDHIKRLNLYGTVEYTDVENVYRVAYETPGNPLLSIVVSSNSTTDHIIDIISNLFDGVRYSNFEIIVVENVVSDPRRMKYYAKIENLRKNFHVMLDDSLKTAVDMRRYGLTFAKGDYILFLDSNVGIRSVSSIGCMLGMCMQEHIGVVSGTLYDENDSIYEKGLVVGVNGLVSPLHRGLKENDKSYMWLNIVNTNHSAISPYCMMVKKSVYDAVGGFSEGYKSNLSGVDFCLKVVDKGYDVACVANSLWTYKKRLVNLDEKETKREQDTFRAVWGLILENGDPFYNPNFKRDGDIFAL